MFHYDIEEVEGGVRSRSRQEGPIEDDMYRRDQNAYALWAAVHVPTLMLRAARPIPPDFGHVLTQDDYDRFLHEVPTAQGREIAADHFTIGLHPDTRSEIQAFLRASTCDT
jgi:hypothetical protein